MAKATSTTDATTTPVCPVCQVTIPKNPEVQMLSGYDSDFATSTSSDYIFISSFFALGIFIILLIDLFRHLRAKRK